MEWLVWIGAGISAFGLVGIIYSIVAVRAARKSATDDDALRAKLQKILPMNIGALLLSMLGLMMVVVGVILS